MFGDASLGVLVEEKPRDSNPAPVQTSALCGRGMSLKSISTRAVAHGITPNSTIFGGLNDFTVSRWKGSTLAYFQIFKRLCVANMFVILKLFGVIYCGMGILR